VVRDTAGVLLADIPRLEVRYGLANILARRFVFARVHLVDDDPADQVPLRADEF
jgi:hypothetical protein